MRENACTLMKREREEGEREEKEKRERERKSEFVCDVCVCV